MKAKNLKRKTHKKRGVEVGFQKVKEASIKQIMYADSLLLSCSLTTKEISKIDKDLSGDMSEGELEELINYLLENQLDRIRFGLRYQDKDIEKKIRELGWH